MYKIMKYTCSTYVNSAQVPGFPLKQTYEGPEKKNPDKYKISELEIGPFAQDRVCLLNLNKKVNCLLKIQTDTHKDFSRIC